MRIPLNLLLGVFAFIAFVIGASMMSNAKTIMHQMVAMQIFETSAVLLIGSAIVETLRKPKEKDEPPPPRKPRRRDEDDD